ncbi:VOC family protein [Actinoplanes derwentensis]|uniref:Glyoxalase-like domain-containing protein n=1 Tax=Actinoplanes derwentensis TaxID=113562 RepID=A0A1H1TDX1_9ACTN|nr:VOC family protein [Actinoplanes derwentensis]GID89499.1 lactoylglutathione lyase [Actinoplanes derwentensis]SDS58423.1 Glyoxalase-like domain-containing protein [Actinoplanes derwentensis]
MTVTVGHVGLNVTDLARSTAFYQRLFGFEVLGGDGRYTFLGLDGTLMVTLWQQSSGAFPTDRPGLHHLAFQVPGVEDLRHAESVLRELGVDPLHDGIVPHGEGTASGGLFFTDPDGIRLEIYTPAIDGVTATAPTPDAPTCGFF